MYEQKFINEETRKYIETEDDIIFEKLIEKLIPMIDTQLGKQYSSMVEFWDDMRQDVLLKVWENRKKIKESSTQNPCRYFYSKIQQSLSRSCERIVGQQDSLNPDCISIEELNNSL